MKVVFGNSPQSTTIGGFIVKICVFKLVSLSIKSTVLSPRGGIFLIKMIGCSLT